MIKIVVCLSMTMLVAMGGFLLAWNEQYLEPGVNGKPGQVVDGPISEFPPAAYREVRADGA